MREDLYKRRPLEGTIIPILVKPTEIPDGPLKGEDIIVTVRGLHPGRAGGTFSMRSEHLKGWLRG